jgi:hypothetical protein
MVLKLLFLLIINNKKMIQGLLMKTLQKILQPEKALKNFLRKIKN